MRHQRAARRDLPSWRQHRLSNDVIFKGQTCDSSCLSFSTYPGTGTLSWLCQVRGKVLSHFSDVMTSVFTSHDCCIKWCLGPWISVGMTSDWVDWPPSLPVKITWQIWVIRNLKRGKVLLWHTFLTSLCKMLGNQSVMLQFCGLFGSDHVLHFCQNKSWRQQRRSAPLTKDVGHFLRA